MKILRLHRRICLTFSPIDLYFIDLQHAKIFSEKSLSLGYIPDNLFFECLKFQPKYSYKVLKKRK